MVFDFLKEKSQNFYLQNKGIVHHKIAYFWRRHFLNFQWKMEKALYEKICCYWTQFLVLGQFFASFWQFQQLSKNLLPTSIDDKFLKNFWNWPLIILHEKSLFSKTHWKGWYLSMKEGSLFCFVAMRSTELGSFRSCSWSWCLWKALKDKGCMGLVPWRLNLWHKSSWILNDFFTEN